jgi:hypothetical protein
MNAKSHRKNIKKKGKGGKEGYPTTEESENASIHWVSDVMV